MPELSKSSKVFKFGTHSGERHGAGFTLASYISGGIRPGRRLVKECVDELQEGFGSSGFRQERGESGGERGVTRGWIRIRGQRDGGNIRNVAGPNVADEREPILDRHPEIRDDQRRHMF